jgi:choline kinase
MRKTSSICAIILAAGRGSRLHPYSDNAPKCLTEIDGRSLIERQIATLRAGGVGDIVIATGYLAEQLCLPGTRQVHNADWADTNMVETLFRAEAEFGGDLIVAYGDIVYEPRVLEQLLASPHDVSVVVDRQWRRYWEARFADPLVDAETLKMNGDGHILDIGNKATSIEEIEAQYIGLMRFKRSGVDAMRAARERFRHQHRDWMDKRPIEKAYMTDLLNEMILAGNTVHAIPIDGGWLEFDTTDDFHKFGGAQVSALRDSFFNPATTPGDV